MCVIMTKVAGAQFPPVEEIKNCCDSNPDGFGAMYTAGGRVKVFKTMDKQVFIAWYEKFVKKHPVSTPLVCHMRIATHGSKKVDNCHPWTDNKGSVGFAHNGILSVKNRKDMTDSETFFRDLWLPVYLGYGSKAADRVTECCVGTSRFAFLFADGHIERWGTWEQGSVKEGVHYTNSSWEKRKVYYGGCSSYGSYNGYLYDDDDDWGTRYGSYWQTKKDPAKIVRGCASVDEAVKWIETQPEYKDILDLRARYRSREFPYKQMKTLDALMRDELRWDNWSCPLISLYKVYTGYCQLKKEDADFLKEFNKKYMAAFPANSLVAVK